MENILSSLEKLDYVLKFLSEERGNSSLSDIYRRLKIKNDNNIEGDELLRILNHLIQDSFATYEDYELDVSKYGLNRCSDKMRRYSITFDGTLFFQQGGYYEKGRNEKMKNEILGIELRTKKRNEKLVVRGTLLAAIGTCGLLLWEIAKVIYKYYN